MKRTIYILLVALAASAAVAQNGATTRAMKSAALARNAEAEKIAAATEAPAIIAPATPKSPVINDKKPEGKTSRRDPFVSPIQERVQNETGCATGKKCLVADQIVLQGVVKGPNGMIALVMNPAKKAYFMRVNDPVFNGVVVKITPDSIVFRETTQDRLGKPVSREITKKVSAPV